MATNFLIHYPSAAASAGNTNVNIHDASGNNINNGQQTMANSVPVAIASDQSAVPVSAASLPLPAGAATAALQTTGNTSLASIDGKTPAVGQALMAASSPVVIASNQSAVAISASSLPLPTGAATAAKQPAIGTAGVSSVDVLSIQGIASGTAVPVSIAAAIPTKSPVNTNGSIVNTALTATTAASAAAPGNAVGFILEAPSTNTTNINWCIGGTASTSVGFLMEPGRDTGFVPCAATVSVCAATSGTNAFVIQWILSS